MHTYSRYQIFFGFLTATIASLILENDASRQRFEEKLQAISAERDALATKLTSPTVQTNASVLQKHRTVRKGV